MECRWSFTDSMEIYQTVSMEFHINSLIKELSLHCLLDRDRVIKKTFK